MNPHVQKAIDHIAMGFWLMMGASLCMWCLQVLVPMIPVKVG